ncbi:MAG: hypothetical protein ABJF11_10360 [Reichenbachiella sp.]|uniref:hypothetical protein n=1 Tax=Reichenbachiella sp. TaxID=2184521 RepID=UPI003266C083
MYSKFPMMTNIKYILIILSSLFYTTSQAQQYTDDPKANEIKSLIGKEKEITGFGNVDLRVGEFVSQQVLIVGAYGGILINKNVMFGVGGYGIATESQFEGFNPETNEQRDLNIYGGYAGMLLGFKVASKEIIHLSVPILLGAGHIDISDDNYFDLSNGDNDFTVESSAFFVLEPSALLELNISNHFRLGFGAGYRIVKGSSLENLSDDDLSGFTGVVSFQLGRF